MGRHGFLLLILLCTGSITHAQNPPANLDELLESVRKVQVLEKQIDDERVQNFIAKRKAREQLLTETAAQLERARRHQEQLQEQVSALRTQVDDSEKTLETASKDLQSLYAAISTGAADALSLIKTSLVSSQLPGRTDHLQALVDKQSLPSIQAIHELWQLLLGEIVASAKIARFHSKAISKDGTETELDFVRIGAFTIFSGNRFFRYLPNSAQLVELNTQPSSRFRDLAADFVDSNAGGVLAVPIDPSRGAVFTVTVPSLTMYERILQGGLIAMLILLLGGLGLGLLVLRLLVVGFHSRRIRKQEKQSMLARDNMLGRLLHLHQEYPDDRDPESLVLRLEEQMQKESSKLTPGLRTLGMFAAIAPLLGLLGTVTGMIETFQSIALVGTGDPKLMSGGISQALVTTELGLAVAIPLMIGHTALQSVVRKILHRLDEASIALVAERLETEQGNTSLV